MTEPYRYQRSKVVIPNPGLTDHTPPYHLLTSHSPNKTESGTDRAFLKSLRWIVPTVIALIGAGLYVLNNTYITP